MKASKKYFLVVKYPSQYDWDKTIVKIVKRSNDFAGCGGGRLDMEWIYKYGLAAEKAKARILKHKSLIKKGLRVFIEEL